MRRGWGTLRSTQWLWRVRSRTARGLIDATTCVELGARWTACVALAALGIAGGCSPSAAPALPGVLPDVSSSTVVEVVQPVHEYFWSFDEDLRHVNGKDVDHNPFRFYTHLGTDCGRMGPGENQIRWQHHEVHVDRRTHWAGMWHSLAGLARDRDTAMDFDRCYPAFIGNAWQPRCVGVTARVKGSGWFRLELKSPGEVILWNEAVNLAEEDYRTFVFRFSRQDLDALDNVKLLNWVAEPGTQAAVDSVGLLVRFPDIPMDKRAFLVSYAKLARCYSEADGTVRDRANFPAGDYDCVPTSGLFCLATALAAELDLVDRSFAIETLHKVYNTVASVPRARGVLPHFIRKYDGRYRIHAGTEFSTVDTSLYYHGMLLAARILDDAETETKLVRDVRAIEFAALLTPEGFVTHGLMDDGTTRLKSAWGDWGGETALVLLLQRMAQGDAGTLRMKSTGQVHQGIGFILEIQNLFYREFDADGPDAVTQQNWRQKRRDLLDRQMDYFAADSAAAGIGVFGLSAGEGARGLGYAANGVEMPHVAIIHPHYLLMSATARSEPRDVYQTLESMERRELLPPWGLVENVNPELTEYLPLLGSLNASFECLGAYHLWAKTNAQPDAVYDAVAASPSLSNAIRSFYPPNP